MKINIDKCLKSILAFVLTFSLIGSAIAQSVSFTAQLSGLEVVPPNNSLARGVATFKLNADGTSIQYRLIVANIKNVFMAHIHRAAAGSNGPIIVWLYPSTTLGITAPAGQGPMNGVIATGTISTSNFVGPLAGQPVSTLINDFKTGNAYISVNTNDGVVPPNMGPGDFPAGELRGQVK